ncbi:retron system putative HNH endonuclease [Paraburkholderia phenazinium]|jgi:uncharacterized protein (TIGR02646 family)|uniref:TIGR02646 family protein n=1 Tax=Paraburkholderia phenazinium TaxID=60549 RepID=A0A1G8DU17_9BURK|nr:retron system putative HNH endonuclease [Paraburkholderia phenazinium]SDH61157.1 TIGR02646 family protein [Paraburkholderia phenazinium]
MRFVAKDREPDSLAAWKEQVNEEWTPSYPDLQNPEKRDVHLALLTEQGGTCCYCGRRISLEESHIEHFVPQEASEDLALEYRNLHASCIRALTPRLPLHCGHAKGQHLDLKRSISPLDPAYEHRFRYALDGGLLPANEADENARYMIDLLKLDIAALRNRREAILAGMFDNEFLASATDEDLEKIRETYRTRDGDRNFQDFAHVIARFAEQLMGV